MDAPKSPHPVFVRQQGETVLLSVRVLPRSSRNDLTVAADGLRAHLTAPPVAGAANEALIVLVAGRLKLPKRQVSLLRGEVARQKVLAVTGLSAEECWKRLQG